ncbi:hypothetical protein BS17DRAFT_717209, partial [Gyrodon lividus]
SIGIRLGYGPGTLLGISGKVLQHGVPHSVSDRVCLAYHMRDNVHEGVGAHRCDWVRQGDVKSGFVPGIPRLSGVQRKQGLAGIPEGGRSGKELQLQLMCCAPVRVLFLDFGAEGQG